MRGAQLRRVCFWWFLGVFLFGPPVTGQHLHPGASGLPHGIPDPCTSATLRYIVPAGDTLTLSGRYETSCLGVHGTLRVEPGALLLVDDLIVYDDGTLTQTGGEVVFRDRPLNTALDPEQFGRGFIALGRVRIQGASVTPFVRASTDIRAGDRAIAVPTPMDWTVGQRLVVPETRALGNGDYLPGRHPGNDKVPVRSVSQSEVCTIAAVSSVGVMCTAPLAFDHLGAHSPAQNGQPAIDLYPHIGNLTRSIVFRSENPNGTRFHVLFSQRADVQIAGAEFVDCGRTTGAMLDSTVFNADGTVAKVGTNQIGRYCIHAHHLFGPASTADAYQFRLSGNVVRGGLKWGFAIHNSHYGLINGNVVYGVQGAGILTEDGNEIQNHIDGNLVVKAENPQFDGTKLSYDPEGQDGACLWSRGPGNHWTRNICYEAAKGFQAWTGNAEDGPQAPTAQQRIPRARGLDTTIDANVTLTPTNRIPQGVIDGNELVSLSQFGIETWWHPGSLRGQDTAGIHRAITNTTIWHVTGACCTDGGHPFGNAINGRYSDLVFDGVTALNPNVGAFAVFVNDAGASNAGRGQGFSELHRVDARGWVLGFLHGGQVGMPIGYTFTHSFYQARQGFVFGNRGESASTPFVGPDSHGHEVWRSALQFDTVRFAPLAGESTYTAIGFQYDTNPHSSFNAVRQWAVTVRSHQGIQGQDFRVWAPAQHPDAPAPYGGHPDLVVGKTPEGFPIYGLYLTRPYSCPEPLTNRACWAKYHIAALHELPPDGTTTRPEIDGLLSALDASAPAPVPVPVPVPTPTPTPQPEPTPTPPPAPTPVDWEARAKALEAELTALKEALRRVFEAVTQ